MKRFCVVVPLYKNTLNENEKICYDSIFRNFPNDDIIFVCPKNLDITKFTEIKNVICFENEYFKSVRDYSRMLTSTFFYEAFSEYEYILIHQIDAYTIKNNIDYFINMGYDYYGALVTVWPGSKQIVGNGGYCLRKVQKFIEVTKEMKPKTMAEDRVFCVEKKECFNFCPIDVAKEFSWEVDTSGEKLPMGLHKLYFYHNDLWKKIINNQPIDFNEKKK